MKPLNEQAIKIGIKLIKLSEGCVLKAYPDPASELSKALSVRNLLRAYCNGTATIPKEIAHLSGAPWSIGYGETLNIKEGTIWSQMQADEALDKRARQFLTDAIKATPNLENYSAEKQAAILSLVYNLGITNYKKYDISKQVQAGNHIMVVAKFKQYVYANGVINQGLVNRRQREADLYASRSD